MALNIAAFPRNLPKEVISSILEGGFSKAKEANTSIVGGHTIDDNEPKYGLAVTGFVKTGKQITIAQSVASVIAPQVILQGIGKHTGKRNFSI